MNQSLSHTVDNALREFNTHALKDINKLKLMDRVDSKFVVPVQLLPLLLQESQRQYSLLSINGVQRSNYSNVYFDTDGFNYYLMHHNGKLNRVKVRHRHYVDTATAFIELKFKNNKGRTLKTRIQASPFHHRPTAKSWTQDNCTKCLTAAFCVAARRTGFQCQ